MGLRLKLVASLTPPIIMLVSGCAAPPSQQPTSTSTQTVTNTFTSTTPKSSTPSGPYGHLRVAVSSFGAEKWDPITTDGTNILNIIAPMSEHMFRTKERDLAPGLVEKWEMSDGPSWVFTINKNIKWHDGTSMTSQDVKFSLERYASKEAYYGNLRDTTTGKVDIIDQYTVKVYTKGPQPYVPWYLSTGIGSQGITVPKDYFEKNGAEYFEKHPMGNGPFKVVRYVPGDMVEYEALSEHFREVPKFKKMSVIMVPEDTTRIAMLRTDAVDMIDVDMEGAAEAESAGMKTAPLVAGSENLLFHGAYMPAAAKMPTGDIRVRQALSLAIDRLEILSTIMRGKSGVAAPGMNSYNTPDIDVEYWKEYTAKAWRYDPEEAKKLLNEAGYANGFEIKIYSYRMGGAPYLPKLGEVVQGYWKKVGVNATIVPIDWGVFSKLRTSAPGRNPPAEYVGQVSIGSSSEAPIALRKINTGWTSGGTWNLLSGTMPEVDQLYSAGLSELDEVKRKEIIAKLLKIATDSYTAVGISTTSTLTAMGPHVDVDFGPMSQSIPSLASAVRHRD